MLTGGLLALAGCGGSAHVVTKIVTRPATVSTPAPKPAPAPSSGATAAAGTFAATAIAGNAVQAASPMATATTTPGTAGVAPPPPSTQVVAGHASGEYAVAYTSGTFHHPSQIVLNVSASPAQAGSVDWNVVCFEKSGGVGRQEGHSTLQLPASKTLPLPAPSNSCIASANVQLSKTGTVTISLTG